jgi:hypothetical protein|nr:MAG TPA: protein of unknown function (DUF4406) [Caudoviricetes sp.]
MKVFISQPMNDKTNKEILNERNMVINLFRLIVPKNQEVEAIDSFFEDAPHDAKPLWYIGESIKLMADADVVYFCKDWHKYRGCTIEHECAVRYGKKIIYA